MKIIAKPIFLCACAAMITVTSAHAQQDTTLNKRVSVEREYTPVIQDASKINTMPQMQESPIPSTNVRYVTETPALEFSRFPIQDTGSGDIGTAIDFSDKKGYFIFGVGHNINLDGRAGYRIVSTPTDQLDIFASYNSANSDVDYLDQSYNSKQTKAKYSDALGKIKYQHIFEPFTLHLNGSYINSMYNYYGNPFTNTVSPYIGTQQNVNIFGAEAGIKANEINEVKYYANLRYNYFGNKYGETFSKNGSKGNIFDATAGLSTSWDSDKRVGLDFGAKHQKYNTIKDPFATGNFHNYTALRAGAYFGFEGVNWNVKLGAKMGYAIDDENKFTIAPDVNAKITFAERTSLYATVTGGLNDNDYLQTFLENRYVSPLSRIAYSRTLYDVVAGIKIGVLSGFEFDIFGGYKHTKDDHLYLFNRSNIELNIPSPVYGDISEGHVGGLFKTNIIPYTDLTLKAKAHFYDVTYDPAYTSADSFTSVKRAWGKPKFTFDANVDVKPLDKLILTLNYIYKGGRETFTSDVVKMKDINELNFRTEYKFIDWLSVNLTFNNILNQKYETFYGYTHQGFNVMGGVSLIF